MKIIAKTGKENIATVYHKFKYESIPEEIPGFCRAATIEEIREHNYALTPGRYVGMEKPEEQDESFEVRMPELIQKLEDEFEQARMLEEQIKTNLSRIINRE